MVHDSKEQMPMIFLAGPPGSGKSSLGEKACHRLELRFIDLSTPMINNQSFLSQKKILTEIIDKRSADVITLSWSLQQDKGVRKLVVRFGVFLFLWAHPLDMQARSGHLESVLTPSSRIRTKEGFGRTGTGCLEFRRLSNVADEVVMLVGSSFDEGVNELQGSIVSIREKSLQPPIIRTGLSYLVEDWQEDYNTSKNITKIIVTAMARYIIYLQSEGKSARTLSSVHSDLEAAGMLVLSYDYPISKKADKILALFSYPPWTIEFKRKFSDSPNAIARYERNLKGFARFLKNH